MTLNRIAKATAALILSTMAGFAVAGGTQDITVNATVNTVCMFTTGAAIAMTFSNIDPSGSGDVTAPVDVPFKCTNGTADTSITKTAGGTTLTGPGGSTMAYSIDAIGAIPAGAGFAAAPTKITVTGRIPDTSYQAAKAGLYTDTVTLTINH